MLGGCDKLGSFFGDAKEKGSEFVQSIEAKTDGGSVGMLLPDQLRTVQDMPMADLLTRRFDRIMAYGQFVEK